MRLSVFHRHWLARAGAFPVAVGALVLSGCQSGAYPTDNFREMHYQQSQRLLEAERSAPPAGSVPRTGGKVPMTFAEAGSLQNPMRAPQGLSAPATQARQNFRSKPPTEGAKGETLNVDTVELRNALQAAGVTGDAQRTLVMSESTFKANCA